MLNQVAKANTISVYGDVMGTIWFKNYNFHQLLCSDHSLNHSIFILVLFCIYYFVNNLVMLLTPYQFEVTCVIYFLNQLSKEMRKQGMCT